MTFAIGLGIALFCGALLFTVIVKTGLNGLTGNERQWVIILTFGTVVGICVMTYAERVRIYSTPTTLENRTL